MRRSSTRIAGLMPAEIDEALSALGAEDLRAIIREIVPWLDERIGAQLANNVIDRAARCASGWAPAGPSDEGVKEIEAFGEAARKAGSADPSDVDTRLRQGSKAFLTRDYAAAYRIFRALLIPITDGAIDVGQHEMLDEVLGVDVATCATQYVVSAYMTAAPARRALAMHAAIETVCREGHFWGGPLREMERVLAEPLPGFDGFLPGWRALLQQDIDAARQDDAGRDRYGRFDTDKEGWLREVVQRMEGTAGLAELARSTQRTGDLGAWCRELTAAQDWESALAACEEAAELAAEDEYARGEYLDGAALATRQLGREDHPARLERAWRGCPTMERLLRWLGSSGSGTNLHKRAGEALEACPPNARDQRALLHVLRGDLEPAAQLLTDAPGLGWSSGDHPGHVLFPLFYELLGGRGPRLRRDEFTSEAAEYDGLAFNRYTDDGHAREAREPQLGVPKLDDILELAGVAGPADAGTRDLVLKAMRTAAEKRLVGAVANKRRRYYGHAALLAKACVAVDPTPETAAWMDAIRDAYRRYPALQREMTK
jgi:hypothetical protein